MVNSGCTDTLSRGKGVGNDDALTESNAFAYNFLSFGIGLSFNDSQKKFEGLIHSQFKTPLVLAGLLTTIDFPSICFACSLLSP